MRQGLNMCWRAGGGGRTEDVTCYPPVGGGVWAGDLGDDLGMELDCILSYIQSLCEPGSCLHHCHVKYLCMCLSNSHL